MLTTEITRNIVRKHQQTNKDFTSFFEEESRGMKLRIEVQFMQPYFYSWHLELTVPGTPLLKTSGKKVVETNVPQHVADLIRGEVSALNKAICTTFFTSPHPGVQG